MANAVNGLARCITDHRVGDHAAQRSLTGNSRCAKCVSSHRARSSKLKSYEAQLLLIGPRNVVELLDSEGMNL